MFTSHSEFISVLGVFLALGLILSLLYYVNKIFADNTQEILVRFILLVFSALVGVYISDKIIAFKVDLLSEEQDKQLFDLIKTLILIIFSYYFGTKKENKS